MIKARFVFVAKNDDFMMGRAETDEYSIKNPGLRFDYISNNSIPLPKVYNIVLNEDNSAFDYVALVHADVKFDVEGLVEHLESVSGKYDLVGLCGCSKMSVGQTPLNWYCASRLYPDRRWGCVTHAELGYSMTYFNAKHPGVTDHEVACIDGLCIIMSRKAVAAGLRFDESIGKWNCYDTDISLQAVLKFGLKVGVIVRRDLIHKSVGKSISTPEFADNEAVLRKKWGFEIASGK